MTAQSADFALYALVLAAGFSSRAGSFKMALPVGGRAVLHRVLDALLPVSDAVWIVTGHEAPRVLALAREWLDERASAGTPPGFVQTVHNAMYQKGMMSSVLAGVRAMPGNAFLFILPGDYPLLTPAVFQTLLRTLPSSGADVFIPRHKGKNGHPVLLAPESFAALRALAHRQPDGGGLTLKDFLSGRKAAYIDVNDEGILLDLDTPEDYKRIEERAGTP